MTHAAILFLATLYTLYFAGEFIVPVLAALVLNFLFGPLARALARRGIPRPLTGLVIVAGILAILVSGIWRLSDAASEWLARAPTIVSQLENRLRDFKEPVEKVKKASEQVQKMAEMGDDSPGAQDVIVKPPSLLGNLVGTMRTVTIQIAVMLVLLIFLISAGDEFKIKMLAVLPTLQSKKRGLTIWSEIERDVSVYLSTVSLINICFGAAVATGLYLIDMPNALLWGVMAGVLNFIPYIGALTGFAIITVVSIFTFKSLAHAFLAPAIYVGLNLLEAHFLTPTVLGKRLSLNSAIVFLTVVFWGWLWGAAGAVMAIPILIIANTICTHSLRLQPVAEFLTSGARPKLPAKRIAHERTTGG